METIKKTNEMPTGLYGCVCDELRQWRERRLFTGKKIICPFVGKIADLIRDEYAISQIDAIALDYTKEEFDSTEKRFAPEVTYEETGYYEYPDNNLDSDRDGEIPEIYSVHMGNEGTWKFLNSILHNPVLRVLWQNAEKWGIKLIVGWTDDRYEDSDYDICIAVVNSITAKEIKEIKKKY